MSLHFMMAAIAITGCVSMYAIGAGAAAEPETDAGDERGTGAAIRVLLLSEASNEFALM